MKEWVLKAIRNKRLEKKYSQEYMSSKLNINQTSYGRIENGNIPLTIELLQQILKILDVDFFAFFNSIKENSIKDDF